MLTTFFTVAIGVDRMEAEKLMNATAKIAKANALAIEAGNPSAPGKKDAGAKNIPKAMAVSPIVFNQSTHLMLSVFVVVIGVCFRLFLVNWVPLELEFSAQKIFRSK